MRRNRGSRNCGDCKYWVRRGGAWGTCHRYAPDPFMPGAMGDSFTAAWEAALREQTAVKSRGEQADWAPPRSWQVIWPDTKATDFCGDWEEKLAPGE